MKKQIVLFSFLFATVSAYAQSGTLPDPSSAPPANSNFYYENKGQITDHLGTVRNDVKYYTEHAYPSLCLMESSISFWDYVLVDTADTTGAPDTLRRIDMAFLCKKKGNSTTCGTINKYGESADHLNYYLPHCGSSGITDVKGYNRIVYENVFPNINFHLYSNAKGSKYYFEVKPGGNPGDIKLLFSGQDSITTISSSLQMYLGSWQLVFPIAYAYQISTGGSTTMLGWSPTWVHSGGGNVSVSTGTYDASKTLVIAVGPETPLGTGEADENLDWSVYYGAVGKEDGGRLASGGDAVYHGMTIYNRNFPAYNGDELIASSSQAGDWYVSKFIDTKRIWGTYYGGTKKDELSALKLTNTGYASSIGDIWVGGSTYSNNALSGSVIPAGSFRQGFNAGSSSGNQDGLLASFKSSNGELKFNTYFGSKANERIADIAMEEVHGGINNIYIVGTTTGAATFINSNLPQTTGKFPVYAASSTYYFKGAKTSAADNEGFIARFDLMNFGLNWSTLFGGDGADFITTAEVYNQSLYIGGVTASTKMDQFPSPTSSHSIDRFPLSKKTGAFFQNSTLNIFGKSAFVSHFKPESLELDWSTLLGYSTSGTAAIKFNPKGELFALIHDTYPSQFAASSPSGNTEGKIPTYNSGSSYYEYPATSRNTMALLKFNTAYSLTWGTPLHSQLAGGGTVHPPSRRGAMAIDDRGVVYVATLIDPATAPTYYLSGSYWQDENAAVSVPGAIDGNLTDNYILGFDNDNQLKWSSFFGGASTVLGSNDEPSYLVVNSGYLYMTGVTECPTSPYIYWPYSYSYQDDSYAPGQDVFISRFKTRILPTTIDGPNIELMAFIIYPNPVSDVFTVSFVNDGSIKTGTILKLTCTDMLGRVLSETEWRATSGTNRFQIDASGMAAGTYFISLSGEERKSTGKVIKL